MRLLTQREQRQDTGVLERAKTDDDVATSPLFRLGRVLFGVVLAFNAVDNLRNLEERIAFAESKDAPKPRLSVPAISGGLLFGGVGIALWRVPTAAAAAVAGFLVGVTPLMHDFWNVDDPEEKQNQLFHFLKNGALLGAALAFLHVGRRER
ncbi:DoxX family membrane protein [Natronobacterium texcoconense]|uniref:Uncharacterized membrane protein YphA, DoxX/SURF4 family n=1 Tax=Natronobacterium texcoconense TaxID=1095778 RepID=A0A1H1G9F2_NATTX|nr:DoxX family membrane protein [Natronobacterium texcoconense]SDR09821.1 Uncharacterized membrane protein YphA, DoxX/SURF4 family [Natronobacterium texcoconense]